MDQKPADNDDHPPLDQEGHEKEIEAGARKNREQLDAVPEPGNDPLHQGP